ncbi:MAG TPA: glutamate synthase subunit beta [Gemmatimonadaceae bacterium]
MADPRGFLKLRRASPKRQPVDERVRHWNEFYSEMPEGDLRSQATRCMDCGVPFCHSDTGCPVQNVIPEWNDLVRTGAWREALESLHATNNFPEFTGRLCPAPCESACVLGLIDDPVTIRHIEQAIVDRGFRENWVAPRPPSRETGKRVAVIGSGPAGLAAAQQLRRSGHAVTVFEKSNRIGGLLRYGIPDFKLEKSVLDRRLAQLAAEGVEFRVNVAVGDDVSAAQLRQEFDAVCLTIGAGRAREIDIPGRELEGVHLAMDYLTQQNRRTAGDDPSEGAVISARGKHVVIIGGGDTGSDCAGTAIRQGARSVRQLELMPQPPAQRAESTPWPLWPMQLRTSHAHEEGADRDWNVSTVGFGGRGGRVRRLQCVRVETSTADDGRMTVGAVAGSEFALDADLVLLAMGFTGPTPSRLLDDLELARDTRGNIATDSAHRTSVPGVYAAGDGRRGASLIVWAIREGRDAATAIDLDLRAGRLKA